MPPRTAADLTPVGHGLHRPECVAITPAGDLAVSDWRGGVTVIHEDGSQTACLAASGGIDLRPNGVACSPDGSFVVAHLGQEEGGVYRLGADGSLTALLTAVEGVRLPPTNYATTDSEGRLWVSVSTRHHPRQRAWRPDVADGFVVLADTRGARIVADGLHYTNEIRPDPTGRWLYVVETFGRRLGRFPIAADGSLGAREIVAAFGDGVYPDGFAFDAAGGIWVTSLVSNRVLRLDAGGSLETVLEEPNPAFVAEVGAAFEAGRMEGAHLGPIPGTLLQHVTSIAFGGADGRTAYLGSLHGRSLYSFTADVPDLPPATARSSR